jgi:NitT/TauT family transport system substrate-binding protein
MADSSYDYPMTTIVINANFAKKYTDITRLFLEECRKSIEWTLAYPEKAGEMVEEHTLGLKKDIASKAIPNCSFAYIPAKEAKPAVEELLKVFRDYAPESVGNKLPTENFYFK